MDSLQGILEASPDAVLVVDTEGAIRQANRNVEDVLGYSPSELEGMVVEDLLLEEDRENHVDFREDYMRDPEPRPMGRDLDLYALRKDGTSVPVEISLGPVRRDGDLYIVATISDISTRRQREQELQASEERYRHLVEMSPASIVIYGPDGTIEYANETAADRMNVPSADDLIGLSALELVHPDERDAARQQMQQMLDGGEPVSRLERKLITPDGEVRHAILSATPIQYEDEPAIQVVVNDVTELKEREQELQRQNERLDEFASIVSHDIRNPLNVANAKVELARTECDSDHLDDVSRAHERIETLIEDLLTLAREGQTVRDVEPVSLDEIVRACWENVETGSATWTTDIECTIRADEGRLRELIENLVRNAIEYGEEDVTVTVGTFEDGFYVADDGPGIPADERTDVFESGYSTKAEGTGLGLAIAKQVVDAHGWQIRVTDSDDGGARFEITGVEFVESSR